MTTTEANKRQRRKCKVSLIYLFAYSYLNMKRRYRLIEEIMILLNVSSKIISHFLDIIHHYFLYNVFNFTYHLDRFPANARKTFAKTFNEHDLHSSQLICSPLFVFLYILRAFFSHFRRGEKTYFDSSPNTAHVIKPCPKFKLVSRKTMIK